MIYIGLNSFMRPKLLDTSTSYCIFINIEPARLCLITSINWFNFFPLSAPFIISNTSLVHSFWNIYIILIYIVLSLTLASLIRHSYRYLFLYISDIFFDILYFLAALLEVITSSIASKGSFLQKCVTNMDTFMGY